MAKKKTEVTLEELLEAGSHFGHQAKRWHPKMKPYIWTVRGGVHIFDLAKTKEALEKAVDFVSQLASQGEKILFVATKRQSKAIVEEEAKRCGMPYLTERWLGGAITNWQQIKKSLDKLIEMREKKEQGEYEKYTKKENILLDRKITRLERFFGGIVDVQDLPAAIFVVDAKKEAAAVKEAKMKGIKVVAIVDTNTDPSEIDYVIPANDDAVGSIKFIVSRIAQAIIDAKIKIRSN